MNFIFLPKTLVKIVYLKKLYVTFFGEKFDNTNLSKHIKQRLSTYDSSETNDKPYNSTRTNDSFYNSSTRNHSTSDTSGRDDSTENENDHKPNSRFNSLKNNRTFD